MKRLTRQFCLICTCLFAPYLTEAQEQLASTKPLEELLEIEWNIFQSESQGERVDLLLQKTALYAESGQLEDAVNTLNRINVYQLSDEQSIQVMEERIFIEFLMKNHNQVKNLILESSLLENYSKSDDVKLIEILNYVALEEFEEAKKAYVQLNQSNDADALFRVKRLKKTQKAFNLSLIMPGSGQIYAGHFFKGFTSLVIQTGLFATGINGLQRRYFFTQAMPSIAVFQGFYFGGAEYATELVEKRNKEIKQDLTERIVNSFQ